MNRYIQKLVKEQFNIGGMDLHSHNTKRNINIFNKNMIDPYKIYNDILINYNIYGFELPEGDIKELNNYTSIIKVKYKYELTRIVHYY